MGAWVGFADLQLHTNITLDVRPWAQLGQQLLARRPRHLLVFLCTAGLWQPTTTQLLAAGCFTPQHRSKQSHLFQPASLLLLTAPFLYYSKDKNYSAFKAWDGMKLTMLLDSFFYRVKMHYFNLSNSLKYSNLRKFSGFVTTSQSRVLACEKYTV